MRPKTILCFLFLLLPTLFVGQVLQEIDKNPTPLSDPDQYPFGVYFKFGLPSGSFALNTGDKNMRQLLEQNEIEIPRFRSYDIFKVGMRYKRIYFEIGVTDQLFNVPSSTRPIKGFTIDSHYNTTWADIGFALWQNRNSALLIRGGIGGFESSHQITSYQGINQLDFDELLPNASSPPSNLFFNQSTFWDMSLELWRGRAKSPTSFGETLRLGYRRGFKETAWEAANRSSINAPLDRMGEVYLNFSFHIGFNYPAKSK